MASVRTYIYVPGQLDTLHSLTIAWETLSTQAVVDHNCARRPGDSSLLCVTSRCHGRNQSAAGTVSSFRSSKVGYISQTSCTLSLYIVKSHVWRGIQPGPIKPKCNWRFKSQIHTEAWSRQCSRNSHINIASWHNSTQCIYIVLCIVVMVMPGSEVVLSTVGRPRKYSEYCSIYSLVFGHLTAYILSTL